MCKCQQKADPMAEKRKSAAKKRLKVMISCTNCNGSLIGLNGWSYPVNLMPVTVSEEQLNAWQSEGWQFDVT